MACLTDKFVINKSMSNEFIITIKQNDSLLPMVITETDTFTAKLYALDTDTEALSINATIYDAPNGQIQFDFTTEQVANLVIERGPKEDKYYMKPTYRLAIDCITANNGKFVTHVDEVYIKA